MTKVLSFSNLPMEIRSRILGEVVLAAIHSKDLAERLVWFQTMESVADIGATMAAYMFDAVYQREPRFRRRGFQLPGDPLAVKVAVQLSRRLEVKIRDRYPNLKPYGLDGESHMALRAAGGSSKYNWSVKK